MIKTPLSTVIRGAFWTPGATILGSSSKNLTQLIKSLFANNEQGFAYDPNDLSTMFRDSVGTVPVTGAGQPVGLLLDKSKGLALGANLLPTCDLTTWSQINVTTDTTANSFTTSGSGGVRKDGLLTTGKWYKFSIEIENTSTVNIYYGQPESYAVAAGAKRKIDFIGLCDSGGHLYFRNAAAGTTTITSISVRELGGNHAYQTTSSMRPLLVASPQRLDYDTVDDNLITNLPAQLTGCTVVRAVPNVGTQILTNQTIPTPFNDSTDHCGLIVINRALTTAETAQITRLFNKAAGV